MAFTLEQFARTRPFLYHRTHAANLPGVREEAELRCAEDLRGGPLPDADRPRRGCESATFRGRGVTLTDQKPLALGAIEFEDGWDGPRWLARMDTLVFFWPGRADGPAGYSRTHGEKYDREAAADEVAPPALLKVPLPDLLACNAGSTPLFCKYNSGGPRVVNGRKSPRGGSTFLPADRAPFRPGDTREVAFDRGPIRLPPTTVVLTPAGDGVQPLQA